MFFEEGEMPFCTNCGRQVKESHKFCQSCGFAAEPMETPTACKADIEGTKPATALPGWENGTIIAVVNDIQLVVSQRERRDYNLIITNFRSIFAQKTAKVGQDAMKKRNEDLSAQGKGFLGRWKSQVAGPNMYVEWYKSITPGQALKETVGNFAVDNAAVISIQSKMYGGGEDQTSEFHTEIRTTGQDFKLIAAYDTNKLFKQVFNKTLFK
jgi:hypothetical protein